MLTVPTLSKRSTYHNDTDPPFLLSWDFVLRKVGQSEFGLPLASSFPSGQATPSQQGNPFKRITSISDMSYLNKVQGGDEPSRKGVIVPCHYLDEADETLARGLEVFPKGGDKRPSQPYLMPTLDSQRRPPKADTNGGDDELTNVCNIAIRDIENLTDEEILPRLESLVAEYKEELLARKVRRVTFICGHKEGSYPGYFTFRGPEYEEDQSIRHNEPALPSSLSLGDCLKFKIKPVFTENRNIHVYEAIGKGIESDKVVDKRYFTRAVVRPGRLRDEIPTAEYLISETDRLVNDILDALEIIGNNNSDLNHIFINFTPVFNLQPVMWRNRFAGFLERFGPTFPGAFVSPELRSVSSAPTPRLACHTLCVSSSPTPPDTSSRLSCTSSESQRRASGSSRALVAPPSWAPCTCALFHSLRLPRSGCSPSVTRLISWELSMCTTSRAFPPGYPEQLDQSCCQTPLIDRDADPKSASALSTTSSCSTIPTTLLRFLVSLVPTLAVWSVGS